MTEPEPVTELSAFSSDDAIPTEWGKGRAELQDAEVYWLSTVRPDGRPAACHAAAGNLARRRPLLLHRPG